MTQQPLISRAVTLMLLLFAALLSIYSEAGAARIAPGPVHIVVRQAGEGGEPVDGAIVRIGGRFATSNAAGLTIIDGIPTGTYTLSVERHGYDLFEKRITLAPGSREPLTVALNTSVAIALQGKVTLQDGRPVGGARIDLLSKATASSADIRCHLVADWNGDFSILELPIGNYIATVSAPGCETLTQEIEIKHEPEPLVFALQPVLDSTSVRIHVLDVVTGGEIANAAVTLAEAWPKGVIAEGSTGQGGIAVFDGIILAQLNWLSEDNNVTATSGRATVRLEAEGYESRTVPIPFRLSGTISVKLNPTDRIEESEPNNTIADAQEIRFGAPVSFRIPENGDQDHFRFRLDHPARVRVAVGPDNPLWIRVRLLGVNGDTLGNRSSDVNVDNVMAVDLPAGEYIIAIHQYYNNQSSSDSMTLLVTRQTTADAFEPNDTSSTARHIRAGEEVRGFIFPMRDHDNFEFKMTRPGAVRLTMPPVDLWRHLSICDDNDARVAATSADKGQPAQLITQLMPGRYTILVRQYYDNDVSVEPYSLRLEVMDDDVVDDPAEALPAPLRAVRALELGDTAGSTIHPKGDVDRYALALPEPGVFHARMITPLWCKLKLRDPDGSILAQTSADRGLACELAWHCQRPQGVILEVHNYYNNDSSNLPYLVSTWWEPADEADVLYRNEDIADAVPWNLGETLRGSIYPIGDNDVYQVNVEHPGYLHLNGVAPVWWRVRVLDEDGNAVGGSSEDINRSTSLVVPVLPGDYYISLSQYYNNDSSVLPYELQTRLERAEAIECVPLAEDRPRLLRLGEAQPFKIEQHGDRDRFVFDIPGEDTFYLRVRPPVWMRIRLYDEGTGEKVFENSTDTNVERMYELKAERATRYRVEVSQYYNNSASMNPGWIIVDTQDRPLVGAAVDVAIDPTDPTNATFALRALEGFTAPASAAFDADGNGTSDLQLSLGQPAGFRYGAEGHYAATARLAGAGGTASLARVWVPAVGPQPREGVQVIVRHPSDGAVLETDEPCRVRAISYTGARVNRVEFALDGGTVATCYAEPFEAKLPWASLAAGKHTLTVTAYDGHGDKGVVERTIERSEYFGLMPADGTIITGDDVTVRWSGARFGRAVVRYREVGSEQWRMQEAERAKDRRVVLTDLEPDRQYAFQPLGDGEPGPVRIVKRVRGLAFGKNRYASTIQRDYDQRVGVSVRNNGDEPMRVKLECGEPSASSRLLAGFVGEGSEGAPIDLEPGEEREFMLVLSAQDVMEPTITFPIRITSDTGYADEAEVALDVVLPEVKLRWEAVASDDPDLKEELILHNDGDGLTDLSLSTDSADLYISPSIDHGIFPAGETLRVKVTPRLYEGFAAASGTIVASAVGTQSKHEVGLTLPEGMQVHGVQLIAGAGTLDEEATYEENLMAARAMAGAFLNPSSIDWSKWTDPVDVDEDGKLDRWSIDDEFEGILWVGDDTDGDGEIDFVHADIGSDGQYDYSAFRVADGWEETNLVEAYLEMGFSLPWHRSAYEEHDVDIVMNGVVVASLRDQIPEGNYTFRLPPTVIAFNNDGEPEGNQIEIRSKHLRGGHYVVSSDFRIKTRLTGTRVWVVAESPEAARQAVREEEGLTLEGPDYSVSSAELRMRGNPTSGATLEFIAPIRNVGATRTNAVAVALLKDLGGGQTIELGRVYVEDVPLTGATVVRIPWTASAGNHSLWIVVDPDEETGDTSLENNKAMIACSVSGDDAQPELSFITPTDGALHTDSIVAVEVEAHDDGAVAQVSLSVNNGIAENLSPLPTADHYAGQVLLQPGRHTLTAVVIDGSGNKVSSSISVTVEVPAPAIEILSPSDGAEIDARDVTVSVKTEGESKVIAGRVNGGPWVPGRPEGGEGAIKIKLTFGPADIEVMAVNERGVRATASRRVTCTAQPEEEKDEEEPKEEPDAEKPNDEQEPDADDVDDEADGKINIDGVGEVDVLGPPNAPIKPADAPRRKPTPQTAGDESESGGVPGTDASDEAGPVGAAPATDEQPETLPPVVDRPPLEPEDESEEEAQDEPADDETPEPLDEADDDPQDPRAGAGTRTGSRRHARAPRRPSRPLGGFIGAKARKSDWYCTNRPDVTLKFRLPDELKRKKLPKPGTPEFKAMMTRLLTKMQMRGYSTKKLEQFQAALLRRIRGMDQPGDLPGFLESFNIVGPKPDDPAALKAWRENMENTANAWFLRLLSSGDPALVAQGLKARADAIGQFDLAMQEHAQAAVIEIEGNQKLVENIAEALPVVGEMADIYAFATGESALSGQRLSALERFLRIACVVGPFGLEQVVKRSPNAQLVLQALGEMGESMGRSGKGMLAHALGKHIGEVDEAFEVVGKFLTKERRLIGETMEDKMARQARLFAKSPEGIADATRRLKDHAEARDLVNRLRKASPDSDEYARAVRELQSSKTAQALINRADVPDALRRDVNGHITQWYDTADEGVAEGFESLYRHGKPDADEVARIADRMGITPAQAEDFQRQVEAFAAKHGIDPEDVIVDKLTITNRRPLKPGETRRTSVGRDRDVTFQIKGPMRDPNTGNILLDPITGKPRMLGEDINHVVSKDVYDRQFWGASGQGDLPRTRTGEVDSRAVSHYAEETMDQTVTSAGHIEAYNTGEVQLDDFLDKGITPPITRIDDVCDTVSHKSTHWFGKADEAADAGDLVMVSRNTAEGMRQATKQYDDLVLSRVRQYGLDPKLHVPPRLQASMDVFRQVKEGAISPAQAEAMLEAIGTSKEKAVKEMAGFLNGLEKTTGVGWRRVKSAELVNKLADIQKAGGTCWQDDALDAMNDALRNGHVSGTQFTRLRADIHTGTVKSIQARYPSEWRQRLREWTAQAYQRRLISVSERAMFEQEAK